jgi:hypothetical protein
VCDVAWLVCVNSLCVECGRWEMGERGARGEEMEGERGEGERRWGGKWKGLGEVRGMHTAQGTSNKCAHTAQGTSNKCAQCCTQRKTGLRSAHNSLNHSPFSLSHLTLPPSHILYHTTQHVHSRIHITPLFHLSPTENFYLCSSLSFRLQVPISCSFSKAHPLQ